MFLSVVIPAYNEEKRIGETLFAIDAYLASKHYAYEVIVVDDGSKDQTVGVVKALQAQMPALKVYENSVNRGKGYVVRQGLLASAGKYRLFTDADNSTSIEQLEKFLPELDRHDIVIASRTEKGAVIAKQQPLSRRLLGRAAKFLIQKIISLPAIKDTQCGFKVFTKRAVEDVFPECTVNRWLFDIEMLKIAQNKGYSVKELPVVWKNKNESKVTLSSAPGIIIDLFKIRYYTRNKSQGSIEQG